MKYKLNHGDMRNSTEHRRNNPGDTKNNINPADTSSILNLEIQGTELNPGDTRNSFEPWRYKEQY